MSCVHDAICPKPLLGTVAVHKGESLMSVVARAAEENIIERPAHVLALAGITVRRTAYVPFAHAGSTGTLSSLLDVAPGVIEERTHPKRSGKGEAERVAWYGTHLPRHLIETDQRRYSAISLRKAAYHRASWMIRALTFCPESLEELSAECPHCGHGGRKQGWATTRGITNCDHCGGSLLHHSRPLLEATLRDGALEAAALVSDDRSERIAALRRLPEPFCNWEAGDVFAAIVEISIVTKMGLSAAEHRLLIRRVALGNLREYSAADLVRGYRFIRNWPTSLAEHLPLVMRDDTLSLHRLVGPFCKYFVNGIADNQFRSLMRTHVIEILNASDFIRNHRSGKRPAWMKIVNTITQRQAEREFGIERWILRVLAKSGRCVVSGRKGHKLFDRELLASSVKLRNHSVRERECSLTLGVPAYCTMSLAQRKLIVAITDHDANVLAGEQLFDRLSVERLLKSIGNASCGHSPSGITVRELLRCDLHPESWADIIEALVSGELRVIGDDLSSKPVSIMHLKVELDDAERFIEGRMQLGDISHEHEMTCRVMEELFGFPVNFGANLVRAGMLPGRRVVNQVKVTVRDVLGFDERYLTNAEFVDHTACDRNLLSREMKAAGYTHIAKANHGCVWLRSDAERLFPNRLSRDPRAVIANIRRRYPCSSKRSEQ